MAAPTNITLDQILEHKRDELAKAKAQTPQSDLELMVAQEEPPRNFFRAVRPQNPNKTTVIAEIKRMSPSAGLIRPEYADAPGNLPGAVGSVGAVGGFAPETIAQQYHAAGASAISCLTDERFFGGHLSYIHRVKAAVPLPVLRKDFIVDPWQLWESRAHGADAVLLIAEALKEGELVDLLILAQQLQLTTLLEVHDMDNLLKVRPHVGFPHRGYALLGINNRDLRTMSVDLGNTLRLADMVEDRTILVSESGIRSPDDLTKLRAVGVRIVLVGEHLMRQTNPGKALSDLLGVPQ